MRVQEDWNSFRIHFEAVHPEFLDKMNKRAEKLTVNDLRNLAYIKIGISGKEAAQMQGVSIRTVQSTRYRLKKKLNLEPEQDLVQYVTNA